MYDCCYCKNITCQGPMADHCAFVISLMLVSDGGKLWSVPARCDSFLYTSNVSWQVSTQRNNERDLLCILGWDFPGTSERLQQIASVGHGHAEKKMPFYAFQPERNRSLTRGCKSQFACCDRDELPLPFQEQADIKSHYWKINIFN